MSRVWMVVARNPSYDGGDDVVAVHGSQEGAEKHCDRLRRRIEKVNAARDEWDEKEDKADLPAWPDDLPDCESLHVSGAWTVRR